MSTYTNRLINFASNHRVKLILSPVVSFSSYYLYKRHLSENRNFLNQIYSQYNEMMANANPLLSSQSTSAISKYEQTFNNLLKKLLVEISIALNIKYPCEFIWEQIQKSKESSQQPNMQLWVGFKDTNLNSYFCSVFITRITIIISQTSLLLLEKMNSDSSNSLKPEFLQALLGDLWAITNDYINYLIKYIDDKISKEIQEIAINSKLNFVQFCAVMDKVRDKVLSTTFNSDNELRLNILTFYIDAIKKKIESLENENFDALSEKSTTTTYYLNYFGVFYDLLDSNLFNIVMIKIMDYDIQILKGIMVLNFEKVDIDVSIPKVVNYLVKIRKQLLDMDNSIFIFKNLKDEEIKKDMEEFYRVIFDS